MLRKLYGILVKWEPRTECEVWGEAKIVLPTDTVHLTRKGIAVTLEVPDSISPNEWTRWVNRISPDARAVWRSQPPSIIMKSIWYALTTDDLISFVRSPI